MNEFFFAVSIQLLGITIAGSCQLLLKTSALQKHDVFFRRFFNWRVILAYGGILVSTLFSAISLRILPLSMTAVWNAYSQILVFALSVSILDEKITKRSIIGLAIIVVGIVVFYL